MKKYILLIVIIISSSMLTSCEGHFDLKRPEVEPWGSVADLHPMILSSYKALFINGWSTPSGWATFYNELMSDITFGNPWALARGQREWYLRKSHQSLGAIGKEGVYQTLFISISNSNYMLDFIERGEMDGKALFDDMSDTDIETLKKNKGELFFLRGYCYWILNQMYSKPYHEDNLDKKYIPLVIEHRNSINEMRNPYMGTQKEHFDQMVSDFGKAKEHLKGAGVKQGYANEYAASAMLMRIYFLMGKKTEAVAECDYVIGSNAFDLTEEPIRAFNRNSEVMFTANSVAKEVIFEGIYLANGSQPTYCNLSRAGNGMFQTKPNASTFVSAPNWTGGGRKEIFNGKVYNNWQHKDLASLYWNPYIVKYIGWSTTEDVFHADFKPSADALKDKRFSQLNYYLLGNRGEVKDDPTKYEMNAKYSKIKYPIFWSDKYFRGPNPRSTFVPLIRLAEVYLTRASLNPTTALADVNIVRMRAGLDPLASATEADIEKERIKELGFEVGDRILYLVAMRRTIGAYGKRSIDQADTENLYNPLTSGELVPDFEPPYQNFYLPLPEVEFFYSGTADDRENPYGG